MKIKTTQFIEQAYFVYYMIE